MARLFACIRLIASDIGKLRIKLMARQAGGIWTETENPTYSPLLQKPNPTQIRIKFIEQWIVSKMQYGNTYVLKQRGPGGAITGLRVLDASKIQPLVSDLGDVFYRLRIDRMAEVFEDVVVPAREIIHDVHITPEHPLVGVSPIGACGLAATQGLKIQANSKNLFANNSRPSGILTAPGAIADATATRLKTAWDANYGGDNYGKTAVLGDDLKYQPISVTAVDSQLIEQLNWTAADVCRAFGVPAYKVGVGEMPAYNNINALDQAYYSQTLQELIECIEALLDDGLGLTPGGLSTEFDLEKLLRMDSLTQATSRRRGNQSRLPGAERGPPAPQPGTDGRAATRRICSSKTTAWQRWPSVTPKRIRFRLRRRRPTRPTRPLMRPSLRPNYLRK